MHTLSEPYAALELAERRARSIPADQGHLDNAEKRRHATNLFTPLRQRFHSRV